MSNIEIILIALSLSLDAFAVSISSGGTMKSLNLKYAFKMALFFGGFQTLMPIIGYLAGLYLIKFISLLDHWIAFVLLSGIGIKMIYESRQIENMNQQKSSPFEIYTLLILAIATSIDALAIGLTFSLIRTSLFLPVTIIGIITFVMSLIGIKIGHSGRHFFENKMELLAGIILIILGVKILIQHLC